LLQLRQIREHQDENEKNRQHRLHQCSHSFVGYKGNHHRDPERRSDCRIVQKGQASKQTSEKRLFPGHISHREQDQSESESARDEINKAISLDNQLALAYVTRGIGNFYLPAQMGGGLDLALKDIDKAIALDPKSADAYMWKGVILRKANKNSDARQAFSAALKLDPDRLWAKQQLEKTPLQ
jgi:tetratricopeptide (TPR) repeat protein